ncbi:hypothetical protein ACFQE5_04570 [Pseudonocardia hispaniensis]|uniref:Tetratricopeptide repeat protein n=1 Tax=Pseudonocardia hispaniensis TaxID=904933 RepID=A0ABW1IYF4_9PSEU
MGRRSAAASPRPSQATAARRSAAGHHALIGQTSRALRQLGELLEIERGLYGADDERVLELRKQIGLLQLGSGQQEQARATLCALLSDVERVKGPRHPAAEAIRRLVPAPTMDA